MTLFDPITELEPTATGAIADLGWTARTLTTGELAGCECPDFRERDHANE